MVTLAIAAPAPYSVGMNRTTCTTPNCHNEAIGLTLCHSHEGPHADDQFNENIDICEDCLTAEYYEEEARWHAWVALLAALTGADASDLHMMGYDYEEMAA